MPKGEIKGKAGGAYQVFGGAKSLESIQGQQVGRVLMGELSGLFESSLLVQDGLVPHVQLPLLRLAHPQARHVTLARTRSEHTF